MKHAYDERMNKRSSDNRERKTAWRLCTHLSQLDVFQETFQEVIISHNCQTKSESNVLLSSNY